MANPFIPKSTNKTAKPVFGFHFSKSKRLSHKDNRLLEQGKTYTVVSTYPNFKECGQALHGSPTPYDARRYINNPKYLSLCIFHGTKAKATTIIRCVGRKFAYERRTIIKLIELSESDRCKLASIFYSQRKNREEEFNNLCYKILKINPENYK